VLIAFTFKNQQHTLLQTKYHPDAGFSSQIEGSLAPITIKIPQAGFKLKKFRIHVCTA